MSNIQDKVWSKSTAFNGRVYSNNARSPTFGPPTSPSATPSGTTNQLSWTNANASYYTLIERSLTGTGSWALIATKDPGVTTHDDAGLNNGTHYYRLRHSLNGTFSAYTTAFSGVIAAGGSTGGGLTVGSIVTINGTDFGSGTIPYRYEDFEGGNIGDSLSVLGFTVGVSNDPNPENRPPYITNFAPYTGTRCGVADCSTGGDCGAYLTGVDTDEIYISGHVKAVMLSDPDTSATSSSGDRIDTTKGFRAHANNGPNTYTSYPGFMTQEPFDVSEINQPRIQINWRNQFDSSFDRSLHVRTHPNMISGEWTRQQIHYRMSTPGVADGFMRYWHKTSMSVNLENSITRDVGVTSRFHYIHMPFYWGNGVYGLWYYDNVCIHIGPNAAARVELGDAPAYDNATKREILENVAWSNTQVQARLRQHTFGTGTAYLYVINSNNTVVHTQEVTLA